MIPLICLGNELVAALEHNTLVVITNTDGTHITLVSNKDASNYARANGKTALEAFEKLEEVLIRRL